MNNEHKLIYETALDFSRKKLSKFVDIMEKEDKFPTEIWGMLAKQGYLGAGIPEEYGGSGGDYISAALIGQAIARVSPAISLSFGAHLNLCTHNILRNGTEEQKEKYLPKLTKGKWIGGLALTEPDAGSDAMGIQTTAHYSNNKWILNGNKTFITNGPIADVLVVYAKTNPKKGSRGITAFIVETDTPGFSVSRKLKKLGMLGSPTGELVFQDVAVSEKNILGEIDKGYIVVMNGLDIERAFFAAMGVGAMEECLELSLKYAKERNQFGQPIANYQLIQAKLADIFTHLELSRTYVYHVIKKAQNGERVSKEAAAAILFTSEKAMSAVYQCLQIFGGYGYMKDFPVERFYRDVRLMEIGGGTSEIRRLIIARELLGKR